jgi:hypothetical protein
VVRADNDVFAFRIEHFGQIILAGMKGIKQAFDRITSKVQNQIKGCVQCENNDCSRCKHQHSNDDSGQPPTPGCCDLKVVPFFGSFLEPITSTELSTPPFTIETTDGVSTCQVTLEFNVLNPDNTCDTYLNINGIDNLIPTGIPTQFVLNDQDVIFFKTTHRGVDCGVAFSSIFNVSCQIDYGIPYVVNFGDPSCDFCPQWNLIPIVQASTTIFTGANYPQPPFSIIGNTYKNTTTQAIDLLINPTIINPGTNLSAELWLLENGVQVHLLYDGTNLFPVIWNLVSGGVIGFTQSASNGCLETETFINNETCDIFIGSQIMNNSIPC